MERAYCKLPIGVTPSNNDLLDIKDKEMVKEAKLKNYSLVYYYYLSRNDKAQALNVLLEEEKSLCNLPAVKEIVHTYLYFNDYEGALEYISRSKAKVPSVRPLEYLIKIHLTEKKLCCSDNTLFELVKEGIIAAYDKRLIKVLIDFYKRSCKGCFLICLRNKMEIIQQDIESYHMKNLTYKEAKFLYKTMPNKAVFLKKMVETNPKISKKYYLEYAAFFGIMEADISRILAAKFKTWAVEIALCYGWLNELHQLSMEKYMAPAPLCLNKKGNWDARNKKYFRFKDVI